MGKLLVIAADTKRKNNSKRLKAVVSNAYARKYYHHRSLSARALKILHILIAETGADCAMNKDHHIDLAKINKHLGKHKLSEKRMEACLLELTTTAVILNDPPNWGSSAILQYAQCNHNSKISNNIQVTWHFGQHFRDSVRETDEWTWLDVLVMINFKSKYAISLYKYIASYASYDRLNHLEFSFEELRTLLVIPKTYDTDYKIIHKILYPAIAEIEEADIMVQLHLTKHGQKYIRLKLTWETPRHRRFIKKDHLGNPIGTMKI